MISIKAIREFESVHPDSSPSLLGWYKSASKAAWRTPAELRADFASADLVGRRTVFNISGNKYRLIARVNYHAGKVYILGIMKHSEYNKGAWK